VPRASEKILMNPNEMGALQLPSGQDLRQFPRLLSGDALNKIPTCGAAGISNPSMCDVCIFFPTVVSEINVFAVLWFLVLPFSDLNLAVSPTKVDKLKAEVQR